MLIYFAVEWVITPVLVNWPNRDSLVSVSKAWPPLTGDDDREGLVLRGIGNGLADDLLMAQMNAVKNPNAYADFT